MQKYIKRYTYPKPGDIGYVYGIKGNEVRCIVLRVGKFGPNRIAEVYSLEGDSWVAMEFAGDIMPERSDEQQARWKADKSWGTWARFEQAPDHMQARHGVVKSSHY